MYVIFPLLQMGFSSNLQGRAAHEALLCRQDAELRLLDTMRRCLANKVKCDREYAVAITSVAMQGQKLERAEDLVGSLVAQASCISLYPDCYSESR
jgi:tyrosine-protein kinase Fer